MDSIPDDLLELQARFDQWRASRIYNREPIPDHTIFNIKGNDYRLITKIDYGYQKVFVKYVLTHPEYDKGKWKGVYGG